MIEKDFVQEGLRRTRIDEYLEKELERAGYGGMEVQITPLGTMVIVYAERPGMVIGRGGKNVRAITNTLKSEFGSTGFACISKVFRSKSPLIFVALHVAKFPIT